MFNWDSEEERAALALAYARKPRNVTDIEAAEMILMAKEMLWYQQAKSWSEGKGPEGVQTPPTFREACKVLVEIVDLGYNPERKAWWYMAGWSKDKIIGAQLLLMDLGTMIKQLRQNSFVVVSAAFDVVIDIICGRTWESKYKKFLAQAGGSGK